MDAWIGFWDYCSVPAFIWLSAHIKLLGLYLSCKYTLKSSIVGPPDLFVLFKITLAIQDLLCFNINFTIIFPRAEKNIMSSLI